MSRKLGLLVTDASPLITLAAADALECLTMPNLRVVIPDMIYFEATRDLAKTGALEIVEWMKRHREQVTIATTTVFAEYLILTTTNPQARSKGRGEQAAAEILNEELDKDNQLTALLLYEDNDVRNARYRDRLPDHVTAISTGDLLRELEAAGRIQSSDQILDAAAAKNRNATAQRRPHADEAQRADLRRHLQRSRDDGGHAL